MINVAMINTERTRGGAARIASLLTESLNENCDDIDAVLYHCEDSISAAPYYGLKRFSSRQINAFRVRLGTKMFDFGVAKQLVKLTRNADILHLHNLHGYYLDWETLLLKWKDRPIVWTWHDQWGATGRCGFAIDCEEWMQGCPKCPHLDYYPKTYIDQAAREYQEKSRLYAELPDLKVVSPSGWLANIALQRGFTAENVFVIPNPVDTSSFRARSMKECRKTLGLPEDRFIALFVSADCNDPRKGYADFAKITEGIPAIFSIAVGRNPSKKSPHIFHAGEIKEKLSIYYSAADIMIFTSRADNYPNTIIECLLSGTPILAYSVGGVASQLTVEDHCQLTDPGNPDIARTHLLKILDRGGKTSEMATSLSKYAEKKWAKNAIAEQYRKLYKKLI